MNGQGLYLRALAQRRRGNLISRSLSEVEKCKAIVGEAKSKVVLIVGATKDLAWELDAHCTACLFAIPNPTLC